METTIANYTGHGWQGSDTKHLYGKNLTSTIREKIKKAFPTCKFSITVQTYSGGQSVKIALMSAPFNPFNDFTEDMTERKMRAFPFLTREEAREQVMNNYNEIVNDGHHDVNNYYIKDDLLMTEKAKEVMTKVGGIAQGFNYDDSDGQIDYFDTNFYLHLSIGKLDKSFIQSK